MTMTFRVRKLALAALLAGAPGLVLAADDGWQAQVGEALGKTGAAAPGGIYRVGLPRTDLKVTLDGVELKPGFALDPVEGDLQIGARQADPVDAAGRRRSGLPERLADLRLPAIIGRKDKTGRSGKERRER